MIEKQTENLPFINEFGELKKSLFNGGSPSWLNDLRQAGLDRFTQLGFPTTKDEEWKYTNILPITERTFNLNSDANITNATSLEEYTKNDDIRIVLVNGVLSTELSSVEALEDGLTITTLSDAISNHESTIKELLCKYETEKEAPFIVLNKALTRNGIFIKVDSNAALKKALHITHVSDADEIITAPRTIIALGKSSEITIQESHVSFSNDIIYFANPLTDIFLDENATLHYYKAQNESFKAYHIGNTRVWQERNSNLDSLSLMTGSSITRNNLDIVLNGEGCNSTLNGLYSLSGDQHADNHTSVDHRFPNCTSNQLYKGILNNASRAVFNGKIFVRPIAQQTNSYQLNKNILLGKDCRVDTKPQLEIFADDVKCTHGATIGQLNEDEIFYLQSRCVGRRDAIRMLARGFIDDLLNTVPNEAINQKLHTLLEPSLNNL